MRPQFVKDRITDLEIFEKHIGKLMSHINGQGKEVDIADLFYRLTLDSATDYLLGKTVHSLDDPASAFAEVQRVSISWGSFPNWQKRISDAKYFSGAFCSPALCDEPEICLQGKC